MFQWIDFPFVQESKKTTVSGRYLYAVGGFCTPDDGCTAWGTGYPEKNRLIGDRMGDIIIRYEDGSTAVVPLIYGYTLWYHSIWNERPAPFFGEEADQKMIDLLKSALAVKGAYEGEPMGVLRVALDDTKPVAAIEVVSDPHKEGTPEFCGGYICDSSAAANNETFTGGAVRVEAGDAFYTQHTVGDESRPHAWEDALSEICRALHTSEEDYAKAPEVFAFPSSPEDAYGEPYRVQFTGNTLAAIATGAVYHNMKNLCERTDEDGFIHTSYKDAPSWRYDGFGPYVAKANSYYDSFYSRDGARAIMTLNSFGHIEKADRGCNFANDWMMYYPREGLTLKGSPIPGHYSVIPNKPLIYSSVFVSAANWPTKYTREDFGDDYLNLGNQETDGHGLMMLANYLVWRSRGSDPTWAEKNWAYIKEAAAWIEWCQQNPELSFARDGLLYGETEAAMTDWTLYANVPCYLGLLGYIEIAEKIGKIEEAARWKDCADILRREIDRQLTKNDGWDMEHKGFIHDPVPTMLSDLYGYDTADMPADWVARSRISYKEDIRVPRQLGYYGPGGGIGYDNSMITQNALLLDQMHDAGHLVDSLCKICYAPRLPEPYLVPEGICADAVRGILRRQGDLANLVQLAEAMKCFLLVMGISPMNGDTLKIMPRLPEGWQLDVTDFRVQNSDMMLQMSVSYPQDGRQTASVKIISGDACDIRFRFGPFPMELEHAAVTLNNQTYTVPLTPSGDSKWAWVEVTL